MYFQLPKIYTLAELIDIPNCFNEEQDILIPNVDEDFPVEGRISGLRKRRMTGHEKHDQTLNLQKSKIKTKCINILSS